jgi:hypothetical protein
MVHCLRRAPYGSRIAQGSWSKRRAFGDGCSRWELFHKLAATPATSFVQFNLPLIAFGWAAAMLV